MMTSSRLNRRANGAVIGVGSMGKHHVRILSDMPGVSLVSIADTDASALRSCSAHLRLRAYTDFRQMLATEHLDFVSIAVPTSLHCRIGTYVMSRGIHVLIEKPLAASVASCRRLIGVSQKHGVILGTGHIERFNPVLIALKDMMQNHTIGRVLQISIRRIGPYPERVRDVGVFLDLATHDIDILHSLTDSSIERFSCEASAVVHDGKEDIAVTTFRFRNGCIGVMMQNWLSPTKVRDVSVHCEHGMYVADLLTQDLFFYENNYTASPWQSLGVFRGMTEGNMIRYSIMRDEPLRVEMESFVSAVGGRSTFPVSGTDGLRAVEIATRLLRSARRAPLFSSLVRGGLV